MRALPLPGVTSSQVLSTCLAAVTDQGFHGRLSAISAQLGLDAKNYDDQANNETLNLVPRVNSVGAVSKAELISLYSDHLVNGVARPYYDKIKTAAPNQKCPLCGVGAVAVLDHHLPKTKYPNLSIVPENLVPACRDCNDIKKARYPKCAEEQTLHPYYDSRLITVPWLKATLASSAPPAFVYSVKPPANWPEVDQRRVQRHFTICGLAATFTSNANDELSPLKHDLLLLHTRRGASAVKAHLARRAVNYSGRPNSWQFAMYQELASNSWFVSGGFKQIK
ncbi:MAG: hypothetical protein AB1508_07275 [Pseudomonadota bacterium]